MTKIQGSVTDIFSLPTWIHKNLWKSHVYVYQIPRSWKKELFKKLLPFVFFFFFEKKKIFHSSNRAWSGLHYWWFGFVCLLIERRFLNRICENPKTCKLVINDLVIPFHIYVNPWRFSEVWYHKPYPSSIRSSEYQKRQRITSS